EALGAAWNGRPAGTLGDAAVFAFYPNKQITTGEGGMVVTASDEAFSLMDSMRNQGRADDGGWLRHERLGYNYRLDELSAAVGEVQMRRLDELLAARARVAALYERHLASLDGLELPRRVPPAEVSWFVYVPRLEAGLDRDVAIRLLGERGVQCRPYFPPIHLQPYFVRKYGYREGDFPVTEALAKRTISIPFHGLMSEAEVLYVRDCLREVIGLLRGRTAA
ncbi:MAG: polysaccharide biosynthesis protein, partial [Alphaproteobacteria bacterium]|nr:polysaccharide biosynthesis protein [Alphaproteobacteria bacterium]